MARKSSANKDAWYVLAAARIMLGWVFLWAFLDKLIGLGMSTRGGHAWINGVSPTEGFLQHGVNPDSPLASFFTGLAGSVVIDWLFMVGLLGIGIALILGIGLRIAAVAGTVLMVMLWAAENPLENNPFIDEHIIYAMVMWLAALGQTEWSVMDWWRKHKLVKKNPWLW